MAENLPLAYDYHGTQPIDFPFNQLSPQDIDIYMDVDTYIGNETCGQNCKNCWFVNIDKVKRKRFDIPEGQKIVSDLRQAGFNIFPRYTDTFAYGGEFMLAYGTSVARVYAEKETRQPTLTMKKGEAWTSGKPLLGQNAEQLLDIARDHNYGTISMSFHGVVDSTGAILPEADYPIKGVFHASRYHEVVKIIKDYNEKNKDEYFQGFRINVGLTLGTHNSSTEQLINYLDYFNKLDVSTVRFNRFFDHGKRHPMLELQENEIIVIYDKIKQLHETVPLSFQINMSGDLGTSGVDVLEFPENVNLCKGGRQLFAMIPCEKEILPGSGTNRQLHKVGELTACVNLFEPTLGCVVREVKDSTTRYFVNWDYSEIEKLLAFRKGPLCENGCFSRDLNNALERNEY